MGSASRPPRRVGVIEVVEVGVVVIVVVVVVYGRCRVSGLLIACTRGRNSPAAGTLSHLTTGSLRVSRLFSERCWAGQSHQFSGRKNEDDDECDEEEAV